MHTDFLVVVTSFSQLHASTVLTILPTEHLKFDLLIMRGVTSTKFTCLQTETAKIHTLLLLPHVLIICMLVGEGDVQGDASFMESRKRAS